MASPWDGNWFGQVPSRPQTKFPDYARNIIRLPGFSEIQREVRDIAVKEDDVWIVGFPSSGSIWMQELVWLLTHDLDYEKAKVPLRLRMASLDSAFTRYFSGEQGPPSLSEFEEIRDQLAGQRIMKSHLHWLLLPDALTAPNSPGKMIYVARNPKDVCVYYYNKHRSYKKFVDDQVSFDEFAQAFVSDQVFYSPYWPHLKEFWNRRNDPNVLLVKYEDMINNVDNIIKTVAEFLKVNALTDEQLKKLKHHLSLENMSKNPAISRSDENEDNNDNAVTQQGQQIGAWRGAMSGELTQKFNEWIKKNTKNTDITFLEEDSSK